MTSFSSARIDAETVNFSSDSVKMGASANLTVKFKPKTALPKKGSITLVVPAWYTVSVVAHSQNELSD